MRFKLSVLNIILLGGLLLAAANAIAEDAQSSDKEKSHPWDVGMNPYSQHEKKYSNTEEHNLKRSRWDVCSDMARLTDNTALSVMTAKKAPEFLTEKIVKKTFLDKNPINFETFTGIHYASFTVVFVHHGGGTWPFKHGW